VFKRFKIQGQSNIKGTSVCYIWPAHNISMSLAYIDTSGRGKVAALVSLFSIHVSKLYKRTKWPVIENYSKFEVCKVVRLLQAEGLSESEIHRRLGSV
jgi:hypothetical protein